MDLRFIPGRIKHRKKMNQPAKKKYPHDAAQHKKEKSGERPALYQLTEAWYEKAGESGNYIS
jgi:hypothetical protein